MHSAPPPALAAPPASARRALARLAGPAGYWLAVALLLGVSLVPRLPLLTAGFMVDDYAQLAMMRGDYPVARGPLELFTFSDGSPGEVAALRRAGFFPWWSAPDLKLAMFRPLSCSLMWLDRSLFGDAPAAAVGYHVHTFAWWVAMGLALAWLLREVLPAPAALLALALWANDDCHVLPLGWIALRNSLVASTFALLGLRAQLRWRRGHGRGQLVVALACAVLALAASEYALTFLAYAVAYELARDASLRSRLGAVGALAALGVAHLSLRHALGFGSRASDMYVDPSSSLSAFFEAVRSRTLALLGDLVLGLPSGWWTYGSPFARPEWNGDLQPFRAVHALTGLLGLGVLFWLARTARRNAATRALWPMFLAAALAIVPVLGTFPDARLLVASQVGLSAGVAALAWEALCSLRLEPRALRRWIVVGAFGTFLLVQVVSSAVVGRIQVGIGAALPPVVRRSLLGPPFDDRTIASQHLLLLGAADATTTIYVAMLRRTHGVPAPASCHLLTAAHLPFMLRRDSPHGFTLERAETALTVGDVYGSAFNSNPPVVGETVDLGELRATALEVRNGLWRKARFEHALSLDDPSLVMLVQTAQGLVRLTPPPVGGQMLVPAPFPPVGLPPL